MAKRIDRNSLSEAFPHPNVIVKRVSEPCPTCGVSAGERCVGKSGPMRGFHTARIQMTGSPIPLIAQWWWP
ncbi:zinc finger domain-containing protein [Micromonospora schwarzwaldensis]